MKLLEIHKNGINAHNNEVSFYGIDFQTKTLMFDGIENVECAIEIAKELGYKISEIQMMKTLLLIVQLKKQKKIGMRLLRFKR